MRYLMLLSSPAERHDAWERNTAEENAKLRAEEIPKWGAFMAWAEEKKLDLKGLEVTDGPYAETKEVLGGYIIAECADLDEAIDIASRIPIAEHGSVEIRPLVEQ